MSYLRAILASVRLDKLKYLITGDVLTVASYYLMIMFNMVMIWSILYLFQWLKFISC